MERAALDASLGSSLRAGLCIFEATRLAGRVPRCMVEARQLCLRGCLPQGSELPQGPSMSLTYGNLSVPDLARSIERGASMHQGGRPHPVHIARLGRGLHDWRKPSSCPARLRLAAKFRRAEMCGKDKYTGPWREKRSESEPL